MSYFVRYSSGVRGPVLYDDLSDALQTCSEIPGSVVFDADTGEEMTPLHARLLRYRDMQAELGPLLAQLDLLKAEIQLDVKLLKHSVECEGVVAEYRKGYEGKTWDGKKLEGYAASHPEVLKFATEKVVGPSVAIKIKEK